MIVSFLSLDDNHNKVSFKSEVIKTGNTLKFEDKSCDNTTINIEIIDEKIILLREGNVTSKMIFELNESHPASYKNKEGVEFEFLTKCNKLEIKQNKININYEMLMDGQAILNNKISLLFN